MQENKIAVVTGGASGLGAATASLLVEKGLKVVVVDQNSEKASQHAQAIGAMAFSFDVTDANAAATFFDDLEKEIGLPNILINCAGIASPAKIIGKQGIMPLDFFEKIIQVNLVGSFNMLRLAASKMAKLSPDEDGQRGVIISTASIAAYEGQIGHLTSRERTCITWDKSQCNCTRCISHTACRGFTPRSTRFFGCQYS
jgi:NAD(P)-dependent dehydrogenase (short-subunit alcohol dehydrogenase family)